VRNKLNNPMTAAEIPKDLQDIIFDPYENIWTSWLSILFSVCVQIQLMLGTCLLLLSHEVDQIGLAVALQQFWF
jgi:hypothetical protein